MRQEIERALGAPEPDGAAYRADALFPSSFIGFQGHFPGNPVLPGVCILKSLLLLCEAHHGCDVNLREIASAKFYTAIGPGERLTFVCRERPHEQGSIRVHGRVDSESRRVAELKLAVTLATPPSADAGFERSETR